MLSPATETLKAALTEVNSYFQEQLQSDFEDENRRRCERTNNFSDIPAVLCVNGDKTTLLKDLKLMQPPNFVKRTFDVRMEQLYINIVVELDKLMIEGKYEVFNNDVQDVKASEENGNIIFVLDGTTIQGLIPIHIEEDSFVVNEDFTLSFNPTQITTKKSWNINGKVETSETVESDKDCSLIKACWSGLLDTIFYIMFRDIGGAIVEYSVLELFADEPEEMIDFSNKRLELANKLCDDILGKGKAIQDKNSMDVPDFNLTFKMESSSTPSCISFKNGKLSNILNIRRHDNFGINETSDKVVYLSGGFEIREVTLTYDDCSAKHDNVENQGSCKLSLYRTKLIFKASVRKVGESCSTKLENIDFCWIRDIDYDVTGLECLSNIQDDVKSHLLSYFQGEIASKLTIHLEETFGDIVKEYDLAKATING